MILIGQPIIQINSVFCYGFVMSCQKIFCGKRLVKEYYNHINLIKKICYTDSSFSIILQLNDDGQNLNDLNIFALIFLYQKNVIFYDFCNTHILLL